MRQDKLGPGAPRECDRQHLVDPRTRPPSSSQEMRARGPRRHAMLGCLASASANGSTSSASTQIPRARKIRRPGRRVPSRPRDRTGKIGEPSPSCLSADRLLHRKTILHKNPRTCTKTALRSRVIANYFRARDEFEPGSRDELLDRLNCWAATILDLSSLSKIRVSAVSRVAVARTYPLQPAPSRLRRSWPFWPRLPLRDSRMHAATGSATDHRGCTRADAGHLRGWIGCKYAHCLRWNIH